ncbi:MAG TPA: cysteine hydrolase [Pararhizobium sp.]|nr:cysteine hydrolase [Pararhizobium sp.]
MLRHGALGSNAVHLCVDMQELFEPDMDWAVPWMERVLPNIVRLSEAHASRTLFTRFIPAAQPGDGVGMWKHYYQRWASMTLARVGDKIKLVAPLQALVPPAEVVDKAVYSPWMDGLLARRLVARGVDTIVVSGGETDVCVLAAVFGAVDRGYRVVIAADAVCSSTDETHDALMALYTKRFSEQVETATVEEVIEAWPPD